MARYYHNDDSVKALLIIPPTGGTNIIDRSYARTFCAEGYNVYILDHFTDSDEYNLDLDIHKRFYARTQRAIELILSQIPQTHTIGLLGTSVGAFHAAIAAGRNERVGNALLITGGADIAAIVVDSDQEAMRIARRKRNEMFGFKNRDEYYNELRKHIELDPLNYGPQYARKKISLVFATKDTTVPVANQKLLRMVTNSHRVLELHDDHFWAIVKTWLFYKDFVVGSFQ